MKMSEENQERMILCGWIFIGIICTCAWLLTIGCLTAKQKATIESAWEKVPTAPTPTPPKVFDHGRLIEWWTPQGKRVVNHEDGCFENLHWQSEAQKSWDGIVGTYKEKYPESRIDECEIDGTETKIHNYITAFDPRGRYIDTGEPAQVPNGIQHYIRTKFKDSGKSASYYLEFEYNNQRDAIISLGGLFVVNGDEGWLSLPAQRRQSSPWRNPETGEEHRRYLR